MGALVHGVPVPLLGVPLLTVWEWKGCPTWLLIAALVPYSQQVFPRGAGVASVITMGLAWGVGGQIEAPFTTYCHDTDRPQLASNFERRLVAQTTRAPSSDICGVV